MYSKFTDNVCFKTVPNNAVIKIRLKKKNFSFRNCTFLFVHISWMLKITPILKAFFHALEIKTTTIPFLLAQNSPNYEILNFIKFWSFLALKNIRPNSWEFQNFIKIQIAITRRVLVAEQKWIFCCFIGRGKEKIFLHINYRNLV